MGKDTELDPSESVGWDLSCPDWKDRLREGRSLIPDLPLHRARADKAVAIFKKLRIPDVPGKPTMAEAANPFVFDLVAAMFGGVDPVTLERMIRGFFIMVPKKNAKTTYGAGIGLTAAIMNERPMAELLLTGPSQEISGKAYSQAKGMIAADDGYLQARFHVRDHLQTVEDRKTESKFKIKTFAADIVTGSVPSFALIDEVHLLGKDPHAASIIGQITGGMVSVPEALWAMITTQSFVPPAGVFKANLQIARGIRDGLIRDVDTLPLLYELPEELQKNRAYWEDPAHWAQLQPNHGKSITVPRLERLYAKARHEGEESVRIWISQHLNIEMGLGMHSDRWGGADYWERAVEPGLTLDTLLERSEVVVLGIDGGGLDDLLGFAVLGREKGTGRKLLWNRAWCHEIALERRKEIAPLLRDMEASGEITVIEHIGDDMQELSDLVGKVRATGKLPEKNAVGVDPAGLGEIPETLAGAGIRIEPGGQMVGISQGWRMTGAIDTTERELASGKLVHAGQQLMNFCVGNAKVEARGDAKVITKQTAGRAKIDPLKATFNAVSLMALNPKARGKVSITVLN